MRSVGFLGVGLMVAVAFAACDARATVSPFWPATSPGSGHFAGGEVAFDYPARWHAATFQVVSSFYSVIVYLSTAPLSDPCTRTPNTLSCAWSAVSRVEADGAFVIWYHRGSPLWTFDPSKGEPLTVGGRRATLERRGSTEPCAAIGGERELLVTIDNPVAQWNWNEVQACLRGPGSDLQDRQIEAMLGSVRWGT